MYCDICTAEITRNYATDRLRRRKGNTTVEVSVAIKGHICLTCVFDVLHYGEDYSRQSVDVLKMPRLY